MTRAGARAIWLLLSATSLSCSGGEDPPRKDTPPPEPSPAGSPAPTPVRPPAWNVDAGTLFLLHGAGDVVRLVNPAFTAEQALDTVVTPSSAEGVAVDLFGHGGIVGTARIESVRVDSSCVGWPSASIAHAEQATWRVAFPADRIELIPFDSLPALTSADSAARVTAAARAASRAPGDTSAAFRGRPYIVRQAHLFTTDTTSTTLVEVVRLVPQEANPLHEQLVMLMVAGIVDPVFSLRSVGFEENLAAVELLAVIRIRSNGTVALLLRREQEGGYRLQWIEQAASGWRLRWESALDGC
jgi:hypothetical protein